MMHSSKTGIALQQRYMSNMDVPYKGAVIGQHLTFIVDIVSCLTRSKHYGKVPFVFILDIGRDAMNTSTHTPRELLAVTFFEQPCLAARGDDGIIALSLRDLCTATGLNLASQLRRLRSDENLRDGLRAFRISTASGVQEQVFLSLELVPAWISSVSRARATPVVRERLRFLRLSAIREVYNAFARVVGLPEGSSQRIENLRDLEQFDTGMTTIAERQQRLEDSQNKARSAWRTLDTRVRALAEKIGGAISNQQRGVIYHLVQAWAKARLEKEPPVSFGDAIPACWAAIKARYRIAKYERLPATHYADCVAYTQDAYQRLAGVPLVVAEQSGLDLD